MTCPIIFLILMPALKRSFCWMFIVNIPVDGFGKYFNRGRCLSSVCNWLPASLLDDGLRADPVTLLLQPLIIWLQKRQPAVARKPLRSRYLTIGHILYVIGRGTADGL